MDREINASDLINLADTMCLLCPCDPGACDTCLSFQMPIIIVVNDYIGGVWLNPDCGDQNG
jgi:hypothetical protein